MASVGVPASIAVFAALAAPNTRPAQAQALMGERLYQLCHDRRTPE